MNLLDNLKIKNLLGFFSVLVIAILATEGYMAFNGFNKLNEKMTEIYFKETLPIGALSDVMDKLFVHRNQFLKTLAAPDKETREQLMAKAAESKNNLETQLEAFKTDSTLDENEHQLLSSFESSLKKLLKTEEDLMLTSANIASTNSSAKSLISNLNLYPEVLTIRTQLRDAMRSGRDQKFKESVAFKQQTNFQMAIFGIGSLVVMVFSVFLIKSMTGTFNSLVQSLSSTSSELASTVVQHESTAQNQSASVNETNVTVEQLGASARQTAEQAGNASGLTEETYKLIRGGSQNVGETLESIRGLNGKIQAMGTQILNLGDKIGQIETITKAVGDLSNQTNLLALNAAVEAARAGENGKGFAVVAMEIRKLADQSKFSMEKIRALVSEIQKATNSTVMVSEESTKTVQTVITHAEQSSEAFNALASSTEKLSKNTQQIIFNIKQQYSAISQIVEAMRNLSEGSKETLNGISQTKVAIESLNATACNLKNRI